MRAIKKITAFLLAMVMVLSLATTVVYAASQIDDVFSVTFDNTAPNPGETITAVMSLDRSTADVYKLWSSIYYDKDVLSCEKVEFYGTEIAYEITEDTAGEYAGEVRFDENGRSDDSVAQKIQALPQGPFAKITFKVSSTCDIGQAINYRVKGGVYAKTGRLPTTKWENDFTMTVGTGSNPRTETGYSVSMGADQQAVGGQKVRIPVTVASSEKGITGFNAYDMTFTYDPAALTLNTTSDSAANLTVEDNNGTVRVRRYGNTVALGEALALEFTAKKATSSTVTLTAAKFDLDANSINFDAPAATITDADTTVKALWNVSLPDGFVSAAADGSTLVEDGADFTFKAVNPNYEYTLRITTNGQTQEVTVKGGSYTIENVTDNVQVTVAENGKVGKTYTIKYVVEDNTTDEAEKKATVADLVECTGTTVQYPANYNFTVKFPGTSFKTLVSFTPDKNTSQSERQENGDCKYTLLGDTLTGDANNEITVTVKKVKNDALKNIIVEGNGADAFDATNEKNFYAGENYTYKLNLSEQYYDYTIGVWYFKPLGNDRYDIKFLTPKQNDDGSYTIVDMPAYDVTIRITKTPKAVDPNAVDVSKYLELNDKTVYIVTVYGNTTITSGGVITQQNGYTYDGALMYNTFYYKDVNGNAGHSYLIIVNQNETLDKETVVAKLAFKENLNSDEIKSINMSGAVAGSMNSDVNGSGKTDVNDLQLIYDLYNGVYDSFNQASMKKFLLADRTKDRQLDSQDAVQLAQGGYFN